MSEGVLAAAMSVHIGTALLACVGAYAFSIGRYEAAAEVLCGAVVVGLVGWPYVLSKGANGA